MSIMTEVFFASAWKFAQTLGYASGGSFIVRTTDGIFRVVHKDSYAARHARPEDRFPVDIVELDQSFSWDDDAKYWESQTPLQVWENRLSGNAAVLDFLKRGNTWDSI